LGQHLRMKGRMVDHKRQQTGAARGNGLDAVQHAATAPWLQELDGPAEGVCGAERAQIRRRGLDTWLSSRVSEACAVDSMLWVFR
jgi:hypothetical protein